VTLPTHIFLLLLLLFLSDDITAIAWHPSSRYLATAGGADRQIRVWHNAAGIKVQIEDLEGRINRARNENVKVKLQHIWITEHFTSEVCWGRETAC